MEIKVNDYVRTKAFGIKKVKYFEGEEPILENGFTALQSDGYKSSPNIIDLIEVGDYVNGSKVVRITIDRDETKWVEVEGLEENSGEVYDYYVSYNNEQIESIVTKEQFEQMEYKVSDYH